MIRADRVLVALGVACLVGAGTTLLLNHRPGVSGPPLTVTRIEAPPTSLVRVAVTHATPVRIRIPAIRVDRPLVQVGLTRTGALATPPLTAAGTPGWFRGSPAPGDLGPSVITGHVDSRTGPAVFWNLSTMRPGQHIAVVRSDHRTALFQVTRVQAFPKARFPTRTVYGPVRYAGLRLITCGGRYDAGHGGYQDNTIVFARLLKLT